MISSPSIRAFAPKRTSRSTIPANLSLSLWRNSSSPQNRLVPAAQAAAKAAGVVFEAVTYDGVGPEFMQLGDAPDAKPADKLARGYALERMKSVLDMVSLRGY
jgi:hypothetical protein